jgi:hypothetical protein
MRPQTPPAKKRRPRSPRHDGLLGLVDLGRLGLGDQSPGQTVNSGARLTRGGRSQKEGDAGFPGAPPRGESLRDEAT